MAGCLVRDFRGGSLLAAYKEPGEGSARTYVPVVGDACLDHCALGEAVANSRLILGSSYGRLGWFGLEQRLIVVGTSTIDSFGPICSPC